MSRFIPSMHLDTKPVDKLKKEWCERVIAYYYYNMTNRSLLHDKRTEEIEEYSSGNINMRPFRKMYKSEERKMKDEAIEAGYYNNQRVSVHDLHFVPLPLIPTPLNSAVSVINKIPMEITCTALDPLAATKKKEDVNLLKNKPQFEQDMEKLTSQMNLKPMSLGATVHSSIPFSDSPYGLDLNEPDEYDVFVNLLYKLGVETCFETLLEAWKDIKNIRQAKLLEIRDQYKYGVSVNRVLENKITGMPDADYVYPGALFCPHSDLPDYSDRPCEYEIMSITPMDLFNNFGDEICDEETLEKIVNGAKGIGYCYSNGIERLPKADFDSFKMQLIRFEVKSIDWVGIKTNPKSTKNFNYFSDDDTSCTGKIWGQNTYVFYWLPNTTQYFNIHRLGYSYRTKGMEAYQNFSSNIYKSQERSAVENSIGENKKAQIADIKLQYAIIQSKPSGTYIDLKFLRGALAGLKEGDAPRTLDDLIALAMERNIMIGDTTGFDGKNDGQLKPFMDIPGGLKNEIEGYIKIILSAQQNIASFTGINQQLTGQSGDANSLIGLEKLRISSSLNALSYANEAIEVQYQKVMNQWSYIFQQGIKGSKKVKEAVSDIIGSRKADIIERLDEIPLHRLGVTITLTQREVERAQFDQKLYQLRSENVVTAADEYMLTYIPNIKDRWALLAVREKQWIKKQEQIRQENYAQQQQITQQQGQNMVAQEQAESKGKIDQVYAKGDVQSKLIPLQQQVQRQAAQVSGLIQQSLQQQKNQDQINKSIATLQEKANIENQKPYTE